MSNIIVDLAWYTILCVGVGFFSGVVVTLTCPSVRFK